jgi:hypothetical protein
MNGTVLYYRSLEGMLIALTARLDRSGIAFDAPRVIMSLLEPPAALLYPFDVAADGRILALVPVSGDADRPSLTVLVNWRAALPR